MERLELARLLGISERPAGPSAAPSVIEEADPAKFMPAFAKAAASGGPVFLTDPSWNAKERAQLAASVAGAGGSPGPRGWLMIPSGGTGGRLKFARHDAETLSAAVRGFCAHFRTKQVNCVGVLPLHHVSGLMAWMRSALTGGTYVPWNWKRLEAGERPPVAGRGWFLSLVPTQLQRLLDSPGAPDWLRQFDAIFVGGGPAWSALSEAAARERLPISLSYGMTETAAMVAALLPSEFLAGGRTCGAPLSHARIDLTKEGLVRVSGESIFRGYFPLLSEERDFTTEDLGRIDDSGHLAILGRRDSVIITGGEKVDPQEVEESLRASGQFADVAVVGAANEKWGQEVVACYPGTQAAPDLARVSALLDGLAAFKRPRRYLPISPWPRNAQGKLNRAELERLCR